MPKDLTDKIAERVIEAGALATAAALSSGAGPGVAMATAMSVPAVMLLVSLFDDRFERRWRTWLKEYFSATPGIGDKEIERRLRDEAYQEPRVQEVLLETVRAIGDAVVDDVLPAMARLAREYNREKRPVNAFFRGVRRLLSELDHDEFEALRDLVERISKLQANLSSDSIELQHINLVPGGPVVISYALEVPAIVWQRQQIERVSIGDLPFALRIFHLLKTNGLGADGTGGSLDAWTGPWVIVLHFETMRRLRAILR